MKWCDGLALKDQYYALHYGDRERERESITDSHTMIVEEREGGEGGRDGRDEEGTEKK